MTIKRYGLPLIWLTVFCVFIAVRLKDGYKDIYFHTVLESIIEDNMKVAGEILPGFNLKQPINWNLLGKNVLEQDALNAVCISVFLANYGDCKNKGSFALSLSVDENQYRTIIGAKHIDDNAYHRICFEGVIFEDIAHKSTTLSLEGIDSQKGEAITAWMTKDTAHGEAVLQDNGVSDRSLTFRIETVRSGSQGRMHAIILTSIYYLSGILIILTATILKFTDQS